MEEECHYCSALSTAKLSLVFSAGCLCSDAVWTSLEAHKRAGRGLAGSQLEVLVRVRKQAWEEGN